MPSGRGPATPIGIGVTGSSGVNIVAKSPYRFSLSLGETPLRGFSPRSTLCILCMQSVLKAPLFKKLFIFFRLRQHFERLWGQSGELLGPRRRKWRRRLSPQIRKWWISFSSKGLRRGGGSSPGLSAAASCKPSPSSGGRPLRSEERRVGKECS